jgi:hypothetical protein
MFVLEMLLVVAFFAGLLLIAADPATLLISPFSCFLALEDEQEDDTSDFVAAPVVDGVALLASNSFSDPLMSPLTVVSLDLTWVSATFCSLFGLEFFSAIFGLDEEMSGTFTSLDLQKKGVN